MIIAIERSRFNTMYKYDQIPIGLNSVLDIDLKELELRLSTPKHLDSLVRDFDKILPVFELDHEVLLIEVDKNKINLTGELIIFFNSVINIFPLSVEGERLLFGKLNDNIKVNKPVFAKAIERVKSIRTIRMRTSSAKKLIDIFGLNVPVNQTFKKSLLSAIETYVNKGINEEKNILSYLLTYDKTPNFLPSGNSEFIIKVGIITLLSLEKEETIIKNGDLYNKCVELKNYLNKGSFIDGLQNFNDLLKDDNLKASYTKIIDSIYPKFEGLDVFKIFYYFIAIKSHLNKQEKDLLSIANLIYNESEKDPVTLIHVLILIGYTFSFEELYESIHKLEQAPILKRTMNLQKNIIKPATKKITVESEQEENENLNISLPKNETNSTIVFEEDRYDSGNLLLPISEISDVNENYEALSMDNKIGIENTLVEAEKIKTNSKQEKISLEIISQTSDLSIKHFQDWILENAPNSKQKAWKEFIQIYFSEKDMQISPDELAKALEQYNKPETELFVKSGKAKFEKNTIINGFFNKP